MSASSRTTGLDTLRACAIVLVFMYHYMCFVSQKATFGWLSVIGWEGVDLFFVLSGYLIANQIFAGMARGRALSVPAFYARRALRTLPVFWIVLAAFLLFPGSLGGSTPPPAWRFLTFTQNLGLKPGTAFSHAWSLCVEEQFYLVLPLVLASATALVARGLPLSRRHGWMLLGALAVVGVVARGVLWTHVDPAHGGDPSRFMTLIYYATPCRFDEFIPGIAIAMLKNFHPRAWERLQANGTALFVLGLVGSGAMMVLEYRESDLPTASFFTTTFGYALIAGFFGCLVAAALSPATLLHRLAVPGARRIALWSYSLYLVHRPVANVLLHALKPLGLGEGTLLAVISLACVAIGALLYAGVETPFMRWRDRLVPSNFGHFPMQNRPKISPSRSSAVN